MSIKRITVDTTALPADLLPIAKSHLRVDGSYDDASITSMLARAIGRFEQFNGAALNVATYEWRPDTWEFCNSRASVPVTPVTSFTAAAGATDVSANYTITTNSVFGVPILHLNGAYAAGLVLTLQTGFTEATLPPAVLDAVLRMTAHLHEHREILIPGTEFVAPDLAVDATWWVPRL
jgi:uncharacterized phiE125 gp8 family phage protein